MSDETQTTEVADVPEEAQASGAAATSESAVPEGGADTGGQPGGGDAGANTGKKIWTGKVVSDKMNKTIVVAIAERKTHRLYKKYLTETKKVKAHDEENDANVGDTVRVIESRPISKDKRWRLHEIVERAR